ncbi:MAG: DUF4340 domain-containing protein [Acidobacteria bacterium]|nr:DUF4340 domain-containing protein [Acidobacteriota bacterium]
MQLRGLLSSAALLAVLGGALWYSNKQEKAKEGKPAADAPPKIVEVPSDQINQVEVAKAGVTTTVKRGADSKWEVASPKQLRADQDSAAALANTFNSLGSDRLVEEKAADFKAFGLESPSLTVTVTKKDGKQVKLLLGDETPTGNGVFARLDGDPRVFTLASFNKTSIDKSYKDLQDKRLVTFDSDKLTRLELTVKGQTVEFGKNAGNEWQITKPNVLRADGGNVEELVRRVRDAKMDTSVSDDDLKKFAAAWGAAAPVATAKVTDAGGAQVLEVRKGKDNTYYAKGTAAEGIHKAAADLGDGLNKSVDDYRQKKLFDFGWSEPGKVEVHDGPKTVSLAKTGDKWMAGGKDMDSTSVQALIDKLRDIAAVKFLDSGFTTPVFDATVVSNEGKRTEKILVSSAGGKFLAKRDNESAVYEIDKAAFEALQKAAGDVKEPPKKDDKRDGKKDETKK